MGNRDKQCLRFVGFFQAYHEKTLGGEKMEEIRDHLFECAECRESYLKKHLGEEGASFEFSQEFLSGIGKQAIETYKKSPEYKEKMAFRKRSRGSRKNGR